MINKHLGGNLLFSLFINVAVSLVAMPAANSSSLCQSSTACLHSNMPLYHQSSASFISYLRSVGVNVGVMGYCVPTSAAMALKVVKFDSGSPYLGNALDLPSSNEMVEANQTIHSLGVQMGTHWQDGYTLFDKGSMVMNNIARQYPGWPAYTYNETYPVTTREGGFNATLRHPSMAGFRASMPAVNLAIGGNLVDYIVFAYVEGGHAVALNGVEGSFFKIFDPWNRIYNVDGNSPNVLRNPSDYGFVSVYGPNVPVRDTYGATRAARIRENGVSAACWIAPGSSTHSCYGGASFTVRTSPTMFSCSVTQACPAGTVQQEAMTCRRVGSRDGYNVVSGQFKCRQ